MADYTGKTCDYCKQPLTENDDIVVCPVCGTPQHRECWNSLGHCVNQEKHLENFDWYNQNGKNDEGKNIVCPKCHKENDPDALFCSYCSSPLVDVNQGQNVNGQNSRKDYNTGGTPPFTGGFYNGQVFSTPEEVFGDEEINGVKSYKIAEFVRTNPFYYIRKFKALCSKGKKISTNWAACFLSYLWWFSRKNYLAGIVVALINMILSFLLAPLASEFYNIYDQIYSTGTISAEMSANLTPVLIKMSIVVLIMFIVNFIISLFANKIYMNKVFGTLKTVDEQNMGKEERRYEMAKKGGLSFSMAAIAYFGFTLATSLATIIVEYLRQIF